MKLVPSTQMARKFLLGVSWKRAVGGRPKIGTCCNVHSVARYNCAPGANLQPDPIYTSYGKDFSNAFSILNSLLPPFSIGFYLQCLVHSYPTTDNSKTLQ